MKKKRVGSKFKAPVQNKCLKSIDKNIEWIICFYMSTIDAYVNDKEYPKHQVG